MEEITMENWLSIAQTSILLIGIILTIWTVYRQARHHRISVFYEKMIKLELDINDKNKDVWGISENNTVLTDNGEISIDLEKLSYMVAFLDTYALARALRIKRHRPKKYNSNTLVYRLFENKIYQDYWYNIVRDRFYINDKKSCVLSKFLLLFKKRAEQDYKSEFMNAIEKTVNEIKVKQQLND